VTNCVYHCNSGLPIIFQLLRNIVPIQVLLLSVTSGTCSKSVTLYWVTWSLLSTSSYYNDFNTSQDKPTR